MTMDPIRVAPFPFVLQSDLNRVRSSIASLQIQRSELRCSYLDAIVLLDVGDPNINIGTLMVTDGLSKSSFVELYPLAPYVHVADVDIHPEPNDERYWRIVCEAARDNLHASRLTPTSAEFKIANALIKLATKGHRPEVFYRDFRG